MSNLNIKQVANVERRRWDVEAYEKKAAARQRQEEEGPPTIDGECKKRQDDDKKEEFKAAPEGAAGPEGSKRAFLKARKGKVGDIDERIGSATMVSVEEAAAGSAPKTNADVVKKTGVGWHCSVCDCFLKDSHTYLDHINGRKHQRKLGYSMRVERSTESDLMSKLKQLTEKKKESEKEMEEEMAVVNYDNIVAAKDEEEQRRKEERQRQRKERRKLQKQKEKEEEENPAAEDEEEEEVEAAIDPDMAAMMGFSGFGGSSKN